MSSWGGIKGAVVRTRRRSRFRRRNLPARLGVELKFHDTSLMASGISSTTNGTNGEQDPATLLSLSSMAQGDSESERDGRRVTFKSIFINGLVKYAVQTDQVLAEEGCIIFIALVMDTQTNGAQIQSETVYINPSASALLASSPMRNLQQTQRVRVLKTWRRRLPVPFAVNSSATQFEQYGDSVPFSLFHSFKKLTTANYSDADAEIVNTIDNSLHLIAWASNTNYQPTMNYNARLRFVG